MISDDLKQIIEKIESQGQKMRFFEPASEAAINEFEAKNGIQLPSKYKEWLRYSDGGEFYLPAGVQMYGVSNKPVIDVEDSDKPDEKYTVIGALSFGDPILCEKGSEKISIFNIHAGRIEDDEVYEDFFDFLRNLSDILGIGE